MSMDTGRLDTDGGPAPQTHLTRRGWPWLVVAVLLCPCNVPILIGILGTGAFGGLLARNVVVLFVAFAVAFGFAVWRGLATPKRAESTQTRNSGLGD